ncbi:hypothetical protein [Cystobacter fuscus]|uniref:hypothetical protein n=1 Tax=Cystobacter fuscus TaxID=43 RepID=UPI002B2EBF58|nr:hypothetical protein F0U63_19725 [Cystobacter fuscus]
MGSDSGRRPPGAPSSGAGADREARRIPGLVDRPLVKGEADDAHTRSVMRTRLLGEDTEINAVDQARREARLLGQMEHQGEAPTRIVSQLNEQLSGAQGPEFKRMLARELKPQLDRLAGQVDQATTENRRKIAAFISRAAHMAGSENAATFDKMLAETASAEARHLAAFPGTGVAERVSEFQAALRCAASPAYRATLVEKSRGHIEKLARDAIRLPTNQFHDVLVLFLGTSEALGRVACNTMSKAFLAGALGAGSADAAGKLVKALGPALQEAPEGGNWAVRLMLNLAESGKHDVAAALGQCLQDIVQKARERCGPMLGAVQTAVDKGELLERSQKLDGHVSTLAELMPMCALLLAARNVVPGGGNGPLVTEALVAVASLDAVGATDSGQRLLRQTLIAEELGEPSFLGIVPVAVRPLGHPRILQLLAECGLAAPHYRNGGSLFVQRVARQVFRALSGVVIARSQKGESEEARRLLGSALCHHAALYGMNPEGGQLTAELLERLRGNPDPEQAPRVLVELDGVARTHLSPYRTGHVESLRALVMALAERDPLAAPRSAGTRRRAGAAPVMKAMEMERTFIVQAKKLQAEREAARAEKKAAAKPSPAKVPSAKASAEKVPAKAPSAKAPFVKAPEMAPEVPPAEPPPPAAQKPMDDERWREGTNARHLERTHVFQMMQRQPRKQDPGEETAPSPIEPPAPGLPRFRG